ncbi:hypothetical protein SCHPADRAFT_902804 [Schizopora paradoxa]|uniref:CID domain-containing protein n=1 Tax=Schizopora paradoxa TaxID=27342 RepID=A0A0H2RSJ6_9AGAM|nr:hypothetical protein SCHPADRAFT_902804 [Schizopora paradoxa]
MALYHHPQANFSGHPPMPPQGYYQFHAPSQPPPPPPMGFPGAYAYPPPPPDPSVFRRDYAARLSELTMNSRPIIQSLSMIAQDILRHPGPVFADIVAQCLKAHISRVPPWHKLPAFYVLDAISKNVYIPYASKFADFVVPLFLDAYRQVDQQTKAKMEEMLVTWRTGSPSGKEVFGVTSQMMLEKSIWGGGNGLPSSSRKVQQTSPVTKSQVLAELEVTLAQKERFAMLNPSDSVVKNQVAVLYQLRRLVEQGVSPEELAQILQQLRSMHQEAAPPPPVVSPPPPPQAQFYGYQQPPQAAFAPHPPFNQPSSLPRPPSAAVYGQASIPSSSSTPVLSNAVPSSTAGPSVSGNISDLFKNLVKAGLVSATASGSNTPVHFSSGPHENTTEEKVLNEKTSERDALEAKRRYAKKILGPKIKLTAGDIVKQRPQLIETLYSDLPVQCKQCAKRFPDGASGKKALQDHLDEHFRINKRLKDSKESGTGRGHWRGWFISIDDFINDVGNDERDRKGKGKATSLTNSHVSGDASEDSRKRKRDGDFDANDAEDEKSERASYVVVPAGEETKSIRCPVCKEAIRSEFWEEEEEWVWRGVVKVKEKIFHTMCHREMLGSAAVAARLRLEAGGSHGSRAGTPEALKGRTPTPERVLKRKAEQEEDEKRDGTPPSKKIAVAS